MFSAIFGNFLFSSRVEETVGVVVVAGGGVVGGEAVDSKYTEASTQTSSPSTNNANDNNEPLTSQTPLNDSTHSSCQSDWVIVDKGDTDDTYEQQSNFIGPLAMQHTDNLVDMEAQSNDVLLGSFFDKNATTSDEDSERFRCHQFIDADNEADEKQEEEEHEDEEEDEEPMVQQLDKTDSQTGQLTSATQTENVLKKNETWLITPLPCLTSITQSSQQRSMIDNDPLENLLIEHPSMSIFMSATNVSPSEQQQGPQEASVASEAMQCKSNKRRRNLRKHQVGEKCKVSANKTKSMQSDEICEINFLFNNEAENTINKSITINCDVSTPTTLTTLATTTTATEKRKQEKSQSAGDSSPVSPISSLNESPKKTSRKANKKKHQITGNPSSTNSNSAKSMLNKENMQLKALLMSDCYASKGKQDNLKNGQMRRANKNVFFSMIGNSANSRQRKFHNLQQPSFQTSNSQLF